MSHDPDRALRAVLETPLATRGSRPIAEVADECVRDGTAHIFYRALAAAYESGMVPCGADAGWTECGRFIDVTIFGERGECKHMRRLLQPVPI